MPTPLLTKKKMQEYLGGVSARTVERYVIDGTIPAPVKIGGSVYWRAADIDEWDARLQPDQQIVVTFLRDCLPWGSGETATFTPEQAAILVGSGMGQIANETGEARAAIHEHLVRFHAVKAECKALGKKVLVTRIDDHPCFAVPLPAEGAVEPPEAADPFPPIDWDEVRKAKQSANDKVETENN